MAMRAFPLDHSFMFFGSASWSLVGLERGNIRGLSTWEDISSTTSFVKVFGCVEVPIKTCGLTALITSNSVSCLLPFQSSSERA